MNNRDSINGYYSYFKDEIEKIKQIGNRLYKKTLLVVMMDTLAQAKFPKCEGNKNRFVAFIDECADWPDCKRVSLPHLSLKLETYSEASNKRALIDKVTKRLSELSQGTIYRLDVDPWACEIEPIAPTKDGKKLIDECRHSTLLYMYRNYLVHGFREPNSGFGDYNASPYYHGCIENNHYTWKLVYPTRFFIDTAYRLLANLKKFLEDEDIDPYSCYDFGPMWRYRSLNNQ